ncbi:recombinase family protein [Bacillus inaquosorum]|uniref:recombinase family protein n=1 Tax=Bacillus inaquosorum TaxID=483913 RepID=UPI00227E39A6|nr:recombinase family protein [Bacillus inaquosorum]MCY9097635.1 recombinase family protein [Bacillus inaquosorum]
MRATAKDIKHVAMYLRISREKKDKNVDTLENHRVKLLEKIKEEGLTHEEFGEVVSGGSSELEKRPKLQELLERIEEFDAILCFEISRLSRNGLVSHTVKQYCIDYDKPIITNEGIYDLANSSDDRLWFDVESMFSSQEHSKIGKRSKMNKIQMAKAGLDIAGGVPFGYKRNKETKKLEIYEPEAEIVRYIFKLHGQGLGSFKIRDILNEKGIKPARGNHWNLPAIKRIIRNEKYKGWNFFNDRKRIKRNGKFTYEIVDTITVEDAHPPIIPPEEWDNANIERERRAKVASRIKHKKTVSMVSDLLYCGICGRKLSIREDRKTKKVHVKTCDYLMHENGSKCRNNGVLLEKVEEEVLKTIKRYKKDLQEIIDQLSEADTSNVEQDIKSEISSLQRQQSELDSQKKNLIKAVASGVLTGEDIRSEKEVIEAKQNAVTSKLEELESQLQTLDIDAIIEVNKRAIEALKDFERHSPENQNNTLKRVISRILYTRDMPDEIKALTTRNPLRREYPFTLEIEYLT